MKDEIFVDSNILIYSVSEDLSKCQTSRELLLKHVDRITVSSQVINEFINICIKKSILDLSDIFEKSNEFMEIFRFAVITKSDIKLAMDIKKRYKFSVNGLKKTHIFGEKRTSSPYVYVESEPC